MNKPLIPFSWLPASWGLKGKTREIAKAEYELVGYELEKRLIELNNDDEHIRLMKLNDLEFEYGHIDQETHASTHIDLSPDSDKKKLDRIEHDFKYQKISQDDRNKLRADVLGEPWVNVLSMDVADDNPSLGSFNLDWNDAFVAHLRKNGYEGLDDEQIVDQWFNILCKNIALEEFNGHGSLDGLANADSINKRKIDDGRWSIK